MTTQMQLARKGTITPAMKAVAAYEGLDAETIRGRVAQGVIAIPCNRNHKTLQPRGVGLGLKVKVNANLGTSSAFPDPAPELIKLKTAIEAGADSVMDLSTGDNIDASRRAILNASTVMVGTVPVYQAAVETIKKRGAVVEMTREDMLDAVQRQAEDGADFLTIHCGINKMVLKQLTGEGRVMDVVSRGGSFITGWMLHNEKENPFYEYFDDILDICEKYDVTISLGDGLRPGCLADATDRAQIQELINIGELTQRAWDRGVQVMCEGPGHVPFNQIETNMKLQKSLCHGAPFYVLGPLVTDVAPGYDHITSAIGGTLAAVSGADFLCYVTPADTWGCLTWTMSGKASSPPVSRPTRPTWPKATSRPGSGMSRWPAPAKPSTGKPSSTWPSTRTRRRNSASRRTRKRKKPAPCAATTAPSRSSMST